MPSVCLHCDVASCVSAVAVHPFGRKTAHCKLSFRRWTAEVEDALRDYFDTTDCSLTLKQHGEGIEELRHCLTDYFNFFVDVVAPVRTV